MMRRPGTVRPAIAGAVAAGLAAVAIAATSGGEESPEAPVIVGEASRRAAAVALRATGGGRVVEVEYDIVRGRDTYEVEITRDGVRLEVDVDEDFRVTASGRDLGPDRVITGARADRAAAAALREVGGGQVRRVELDDDGGYDVIVVTRGQRYEVDLGLDYAVSGSELDDDEAGDG